MDSTDSWENILSELDLTDHRQDLAAAGYDSFKALMNMPEADMDRFSFPLDSLIETQKVFQFLKGARLEKFAEKFIELGFSTMEDLKHMSDSDLLKCGVGQPGHQNRFASQKQQHFRPDHVEPLPVPSASMEGPSARQCHEVKVQEADEQAAASCDFHSMPSAEEVCPVQAAALPFSPPLRGSTGVFDQELDSLASSPLADDLDKLHLLAEHSPRKCDFKRKGLDLDCLAGVIEDSTDAVNATAGKNVILLMGSTGSGKTCFMHTLAGRELVRQSRDVNGQNQEVWEAKDPLEGFTIGHNKARSETRSLRALWLPEAKAVVVDAPGQLDTRASEIDIATSAVCHRIAEGCRMLRFVVLINCYTLQADRAGGLRRVAELVANVLPDLGKRREHPLAINFFFTHVEALNIQELTPETARGEVHHWLREVLDGSDETESLAALRWMRKSMDLYEKGTLRYRLVDVYNPEWATLREVRKAVIRFKAEYALGQEGGLIQANSVGAILMPASKVKIEYMLQASRDEARKVLEEATPEDVPMLRNLWKNVELVRDYLISLPSARIVRDEISNIFTRRFEVLWQDATALLRKLESDSEDFSELEADKLWNTICVMEGIASLGQGSGDCCFQNRLECSLDTCLARLKQVSVATDLATLPRTHEIIRWQSKINAWNAIKPDWAKQMSLLIEAHCEQAASEAKKVHELGNRVIVVARQENVKDIASEVDALDGWNMEEIFHESFDALQTQFQQVFENASELALSSVKAVLESPASTPKFDFTMLGEVATSIEESRSAWDGAEGVAPQTRARLATWHQHLRGAVTGWLSDLLEGSRVVLQTVAQLAAGNDDQETCPNSYEHC